MSLQRISSAVVGLVLIASTASAFTFEDEFDGPTLGPAWTAWGSGAYAFIDGNLKFVTEAGDFVNAYQGTYGPPKHVFTLGAPHDDTDAWSARARLRFNTPDQTYEQVGLLAYGDADRYVKIVYYSPGYSPREWGMISEWPGNDPDAYAIAVTKIDYFWVRLDYEKATNTYTSYYSDETTTDPQAVSWNLIGSLTNPTPGLRPGFGGWNSTSGPSGVLAEFDAFYLYGHVRRLGDLNCDGHVTFADIDPFILALSSGTGYDMAYPDCDRTLADCNSDSYIDFGDIDAFVGVLGRAAE